MTGISAMIRVVYLVMFRVSLLLSRRFCFSSSLFLRNKCLPFGRGELFFQALISVSFTRTLTPHLNPCWQSMTDMHKGDGDSEPITNLPRMWRWFRMVCMYLLVSNRNEDRLAACKTKHLQGQKKVPPPSSYATMKLPALLYGFWFINSKVHVLFQRCPLALWVNQSQGLYLPLSFLREDGKEGGTQS